MPFTTYEFVITPYNWKVKVYEPSYGQLIQMTETKNDKELRNIAVSRIAEWDCTDEKGNKLEINYDNFLNKLPASAQIKIINGIYKSVKVHSDPKGEQSISPISSPEQEGKPPKDVPAN